MQIGNPNQESQDTKNADPSKVEQTAQGQVILPDILISELISRFPQLEKVLVAEFGFHCVNCFLAEIDTLEEGAAIHGIVGEDFEILMKRVQEVISFPN